MLLAIKDDVRKHYYDPAFRGINLDERFGQAQAKIHEAQSVGQVFAIIAQALLDFGDSHLIFEPPPRANHVEYGWQMQMVGSKCFVVAVTPGSDAETKGVTAGDEVLSVGGFPTSRETLWKISYLFYGLRPQSALAVELQRDGGQPRTLDLAARVVEGKQFLDLSGGSDMDYWQMIRAMENEGRAHAHRYLPGDEKRDVFIWKMPAFDLSHNQLGELMGKARPRGQMILDLRGNGGGLIDSLAWFAGYFTDQDMKIADMKGRSGATTLVAKTHRSDVFKGRLVVLVDSRTASAAEMFARTIQLWKRGTVVGDLTAGAVMQSRHFGHTIGAGPVTTYGASVTEADIVMADGAGLEGVGVTPDQVVLPTPADLQAGRDPAMSRAAQLVGFRMSPLQAGRLFRDSPRK
jgi:C-terminal processing protease CtpA/Prc